jgi:cell division protein ZapA
MAAVNVVVNGRNYSIACNDGEEDHLRALVQVVDGKLTELVNMVGQIGDQRLMLMAALLLADEKSAQDEKLAAVEKSIGELKAAEADLKRQLDEAEGFAAERLEAAAQRVETVLNLLTVR